MMGPVRIRVAVALALVVSSAAACGSSSDLHALTADELAQWQEATGRDVTPWPLAEEEVQIHCLGQNGLAVVVSDTEYWLNGRGKDLAAQFDLHDPDPVWLDHPTVDGLKVDMSGLTQMATVTCGY